MNRTAIVLIVVGIVAYATFLVTMVPATLVAGALVERDDRLRIESVRGTVWHGHGDSLRWHGHDLGALEWRVAVHELLRGAISAQVTLDGRDVSARAQVRHRPVAGRTEISEARGRTGLATLARLAGARGPVAAWVAIEGLALTLEDGRPVAFSGSVSLNEVTVAADGIRRLGDYRLALGVASDWLDAQVVESDGPLEVAGGVRFALDGRWELDARLGTADAASDIASVLELLGEPDASGMRRITLSGSL